tara:strand:+ start:393 stop:731 length:339 start_codon:yes stop_codon:yes gene_type:complete
MKKLFLILMLLPLGIHAQEKSKKNVKTEFTVVGNCDACQKRIEKAAFSVKGVKMANWDIPSNVITIIYDQRKVHLDSIHKSISAIGHDTEKSFSSLAVYDALPLCCQYIRKE